MSLNNEACQNKQPALSVTFGPTRFAYKEEKQYFRLTRSNTSEKK